MRRPPEHARLPWLLHQQPGRSGCGTVTTHGVVCIPLYGLWVCIPLAPPPGGGDGRDGNGWELTTSASASPGAIYGFTLGGAPQNITISLTGMNKDIDCLVNDNPGRDTGGPVPMSGGRAHNCTNWGGTTDDSWSGVLSAGAHSVQVYPYLGGTGDYTLTVSGGPAWALWGRTAGIA